MSPFLVLTSVESKYGPISLYPPFYTLKMESIQPWGVKGVYSSTLTHSDAKEGQKYQTQTPFGPPVVVSYKRTPVHTQEGFPLFYRPFESQPHWSFITLEGRVLSSGDCCSGILPVHVHVSHRDFTRQFSSPFSWDSHTKPLLSPSLPPKSFV